MLIASHALCTLSIHALCVRAVPARRVCVSRYAALCTTRRLRPCASARERSQVQSVRHLLQLRRPPAARAADAARQLASLPALAATAAGTACPAAARAAAGKPVRSVRPANRRRHRVRGVLLLVPQQPVAELRPVQMPCVPRVSHPQYAAHTTLLRTVARQAACCCWLRHAYMCTVPRAVWLAPGCVPVPHTPSPARASSPRPRRLPTFRLAFLSRRPAAANAAAAVCAAEPPAPSVAAAYRAADALHRRPDVC
jgi:hypothetical protein